MLGLQLPKSGDGGPILRIPAGKDLAELGFSSDLTILAARELEPPDGAPRFRHA
jgi:hypothetical protein